MKINKTWKRIWSIVLLIALYLVYGHLIENPEILGKWTTYVSFLLVFLGTLGYLKLRNLLKTFKWNEKTKKWEETIINQ